MSRPGNFFGRSFGQLPASQLGKQVNAGLKLLLPINDEPRRRAQSYLWCHVCRVPVDPCTCMCMLYVCMYVMYVRLCTNVYIIRSHSGPNLVANSVLDARAERTTSI